MLRVSVIISTHNRPVQLRRAYDSVCNQTRIPEEIIIIDDASESLITESLKYQFSPDQEISSKINKSFQNLEPITIIKRFATSQGACKARNYGAAIATGDIIMFLDDDDSWEATKIQDQLNIFNTNPQIGLVYSGKLIVKEKAREKILYKVTPRAEGNLYPEILYDNLIGSTSSVAMKKELFQQVGGFDVKMPALQDYDLWIRCCQKTLIGHDNSYNLRYTIAERPQHQITGQSHRQIDAVKIMLKKYQREITQQGFINIRKIYAAKIFYIAKSLRSQNLLAATSWILKSFWQYPNLKVVALLFPVNITQKLRAFLN
ncbi:MAG: glycosyltransferase [Xenococcus sp. (in: cyanobacteria)]